MTHKSINLLENKLSVPTYIGTKSHLTTFFPIQAQVVVSSIYYNIDVPNLIQQYSSYTTL